MKKASPSKPRKPKMMMPGKELLKGLKKKKMKLSLPKILVIIGILGLVYYFKAKIITATVNGRPIFRLTYVREMEKQAGQQVLEELVIRELIDQEAKKNKIAVSAEELDGEMKKIEELTTSQGQDLDELLENQSMSRKDLLEQIRLQKLLEKMAGEKVEVSDEEVDEYIETNREYLPEDQTEEELKTSVKQQLEQQELTSAIQLWIQSLRDKAKIVTF